jgi:hypothetical protein
MAPEPEAQIELYLALKAHKFDLEITRGVTALEQEILDRQIEAVQRLLESLSQATGLDPPASPAVETPPPSSAQADPHLRLGSPEPPRDRDDGRAKQRPTPASEDGLAPGNERGERRALGCLRPVEPRAGQPNGHATASRPDGHPSALVPD